MSLETIKYLSLSYKPTRTDILELLSIANHIRRLVMNLFCGYVARVSGIFVTLSRSSSPVVVGMKPDVIVIDEASQAMEAAIVYPLVEHVDMCCYALLVGDHLQLPPCISTSEGNNPFQE